MADETVLNLFVSSPGDVQPERERVDFVVDRLNAEFAGRARIRAIRWETRYYSSHETFQTQIPEASACDLVVAIFGARLGSPLPAQFPPMPSGEPYPSGSAYEVLSAMEARRRGQGVPDVYVFRRPDSPVVALDAADRVDIEAQWRRLTDFFEKWFRSRSGEFLAAFQEFETTDEFAVKVEDCLRQWLARRGFVAKGAIWDRARLGSPFPGLAAFEENRQSVFFGRDLFVDLAIRRLREIEAPATEASRASFLLLIGASGSGKSSLLRAGLAPRIVMPGVFPEVDLWRRAVISADADPFAALAVTLLKSEALGPELAEGPFAAAGLLAKQLEADPEAAVAPLRDALARAAAKRARDANFETPRPARLFLGLDQAERLISETPPEVAARFAALIAMLARLRLATVVVALRSDAYAGFQALAPLVGLRDAGASLDLLAPNANELEEMTTGPVALCEPPLAFERRDGHSLAAALVADARGGDALPLLQMTLSRLAAAEATRGDGLLRFADYHGMDEAVTETANEALAGLEASARGQLPDLIAGLVRDVAADSLTGAPTPVIGALDRARFEAGRPERTALIEAFVAKRLLTAEGDAAGRRVRPTHEALLRIWPEAVAIIAEIAHLIRVRHALDPIVREWAEAPSEEKARHLDISPALLDGAARYVAHFGAEASQATRAFVAAASAAATARRDRERQEQERRLADAQAIAAANQRIARRTGIGLVAALALAALAGWQWYAADTARKDAQTQRDRAEHALALATETADGLVFDLAQKFRAVTGMPKPVVIDILERARGLQEQLLRSGESTPKLQSNHAAALAETAVTMLALGDANGALALTRQARDISAAVLAGAPSDVRYIHNLVFANRTIGDILQRQGDFDGASAALQEAQVTLDRAPAAVKDDPRILGDQLVVFEGFGDIETARGDLAVALKSYQADLAIAKSLVDGDPKSVEDRSGLAVAQRHVGDVLLKQNDIDSAIAAFNASSVVAAALARENPDDTTLQRDYAVSEERLGETLTAKGDFAGALKAYEDGQAITLAMATKDAANLDWQDDLAVGHLEIGQTQQARGAIADALQSYRDAVEINQTLVAHDSNNAVWREHLWIDLDNLGEALAEHSEPAPALETDRKALALATEAAARDPSENAWRRDVVASYEKIGDALRAQGDLKGALAADHDALTAARALAAQAPDLIDAQDDLAIALTKEAQDLQAKKDLTGALAAYRESDDIQRKFVARDPGDARLRTRLASNLAGVGFILQAQGDDAAAADARRESLALAKALVERDAKTPLWRRQAIVAAEGLGDALVAKGDAAGALDAYQAAADAAQSLLQGDAANVGAMQELAWADKKIGDVLSTKGDVPGAPAADLDSARRRGELSVALVDIGHRLLKAGYGADALAAFGESAALAKALGDEAAASPLWLRQEAAALQGVGEALRQKGDFDGALDAYRRCVAIDQPLLRANPSDRALRGDDALEQEAIADILQQRADPAGAASAFQAAAGLRKGLADETPEDSQDRRLQAIDADEFAAALVAQGDSEGASDALRESRSALSTLPEDDPMVQDWRRRSAVVGNKIGRLLLAKDNPAGALVAVGESLATMKALLATDPFNALWRDDVAFTQGALGDALQAKGDLVGAASAYRDGLAIEQALTREQPGAAQFQLRLISIAGRLGQLLASQSDRTGALDAYEAERAAAAALVAANSGDPASGAALKQSVANIGAVANTDLLARDYAGALAALDKATPVAPDQTWLDFIRAASLMFQGHADEARALFLKHRGEAVIGGKSWEQATTEGFAKLHANGQSDPLMDQILAAFAAPK